MDLGQVGVRERLLNGDALGRVELQHRLHQLDRRRSRVREQRPERAALRAAQILDASLTTKACALRS